MIQPLTYPVTEYTTTAWHVQYISKFFRTSHKLLYCLPVGRTNTVIGLTFTVHVTWHTKLCTQSAFFCLNAPIPIFYWYLFGDIGLPIADTTVKKQGLSPTTTDMLLGI